MKTTFSLIFSVLLTFTNYTLTAQANYYKFMQTSGTYTPLVNDTLISPANFGTQGQAWILPLTGEQFNWFGKNFNVDGNNTTVVFSNNGFLRVEDDSTFIVLDAMFTYTDSIDANSELSYVIEGNSGKKVIKVQWKNLSLRNGQPSNYVNYQIWAYQESGIFEIHYGPSSANNQSGFTTSTGPNIGLFYSLTNFTKMFEKIWVNGSPGNYTLDSARTVTFDAVSGAPPEGTIFRYLPKTTGIISIQDQNSLTLFPNPADSYLNIKSSKPLAEQLNIIISDTEGKTLYTTTMNTGMSQTKVKTEGFPAGIYYLSINDGMTKTTRAISITH